MSTLGKLLLQKELRCAVAESCTGGLIAAAITDYPGCSSWFECGFVTYSNHAKHAMLGVPLSTLQTFGAVSKETAQAMAEGALYHSQAELSVAITGIAGPDGGTFQKPVGTVWFAWAQKNKPTLVIGHQLQGSRTNIRQQAMLLALQGLIASAQS
ncbi:MAG: damage-inducible protein CinA [Legionella sp.]|nr:MAG: damage-inducible protein CinA [Legionella sp.]